MKKRRTSLVLSLVLLLLTITPGTVAYAKVDNDYYAVMCAKINEVTRIRQEEQVIVDDSEMVEKVCKDFLNEWYLALQEERYPDFNSFFAMGEAEENIKSCMMYAASGILSEQRLYKTEKYQVQIKNKQVFECEEGEKRLICNLNVRREQYDLLTQKKRSMDEESNFDCEFVLINNGQGYRIKSFVPIVDSFFANASYVEKMEKGTIIASNIEQVDRQTEDTIMSWKKAQWDENWIAVENEINLIGESDEINAYPNLQSYTTSMRNGAVSYARAYWDTPNPEYENYASVSGGDCANFVSQCLNEGAGFPLDRVGKNDTVKWSKKYSNGKWYRETASWSGASAQFTYFRYNDSSSQAGTIGGMSANTGAFSSIANAPSSLRIGDVIYHASSSSAAPYHSTIIVGFERGSSDQIVDVLYAAHTSNVYGASLRSRLLDGVIARYAHIRGYY